MAVCLAPQGAGKVVMRLDLSRFKAGEQRVDKTYDPAAFGLTQDDEFRIVGPVVLATEVRKDTKKVRLVGTVKTTLECDCGRCLEPFTVPVDSSFDLLYLPAGATVEAAPDEELEIQSEDVGVSFYKDDEIDLRDLMREQFYLALPMKPLCRADCRGLCPMCGINRNRETCTCEAAWVDPRLEVLKQFKRD